MYSIKNKKTGEVTEVVKPVFKQLMATGEYVEVDPNAKPEPINPTVQPPEGMHFTGSSPAEVAPDHISEWEDLPTLEEAKADPVVVKPAPKPAPKPVKKPAVKKPAKK
jgi:hypothetical protein